MSTQLSRKPIGEISWEDLELLVKQQVSESLTLDFKRAFPGRDKPTELSKDVLGMANASGGDLVYGISDGGVCAGKLEGVGVRKDVQAELDRSMQLLEKHSVPRIFGVRYQVVESSTGKCAVVVRVPASSLAPHAVRSGTEPETLTYYLRTSESHVRTMPEDEVRRRYVSAADLSARVERVRMAAYHGVGEPLIPVGASRWVQVKCIFIPVGRSGLGDFFTVEQLRKAVALLRFPPRGDHGGQHPIPLLQGLLISRNSVNDLGQFWLAQRDGSFVWVDTSTNIWLAGYERAPEKPLFPRYETEFSSTFGGLKQAFESLEITQPIAVCLSLSNARGAAIPADPALRLGGYACLHDEVHAPAILLECPGMLTPEIMKPAYDIIMNAFGIDKSVSHLKSYA